jgi:NAD(P)H-hydrate epimerase
MTNASETPTERRLFTDDGIEVPAVTADQMREVDRIAMEETGPNLFQMMENAGRNLALLALEVLGRGWEKARIITLAGSGGNGGGGICASRHLANRNAKVKLCLSDPDHLGEVPSFQRKVFGFTTGQEIEATGVSDESADLILDALIGYGMKSAPLGCTSALIKWASQSNSPVLALDLPSGVNATTGEAPGDVIKARWTMTLALPKTGLRPETSGRLFLADIGIPEATYRRLGLNYKPPFGGRFCVPLTWH